MGARFGLGVVKGTLVFFFRREGIRYWLEISFGGLWEGGRIVVRWWVLRFWRRVIKW